MVRADPAPGLALTNETLVTSDGVTNVLARTYDSQGRTDAVTLDNDHETSFAYSGVGRLSTVTWTNSSVDAAYAATYAYLPDSDVVAGYDINVGTTCSRRARASRRSAI